MFEISIRRPGFSIAFLLARRMVSVKNLIILSRENVVQKYSLFDLEFVPIFIVHTTLGERSCAIPPDPWFCKARVGKSK